MQIPPSLRLLGIAIALTPTVTRAEDVAREPAADGTVSVVVSSPAGSRDEQAAVSVATDVLAQSLEPLESGLRGGPPVGSPSAGPVRPTGAPAMTGLTVYARPLPLVEALERSGDRSRRLWISQAYWKVSAGFAMLRWSTEALERLELIAPGGDPHDRAVIDVAVSAARADLADARAELIAAQQELVDLVRLPAGDPLPWPVDRPLAGPYQTHFDTIFANRAATGRIRAIVQMLPSKHEALEARAAAVVAAQRAMQMAEADHAKGQRPIEAVTAAHAAVTGQQLEFVTIMKAYNLDIAEYAMAVADLSVPDDRFVSMLIGTPIQWRPLPVAATPTATVPAPTPASPGTPPPVSPGTPPPASPGTPPPASSGTPPAAVSTSP
jgi:hypothetical protein